MDETDLLSEFIEQASISDPIQAQVAAELYQQYQDWAGVETDITPGPDFHAEYQDWDRRTEPV